MRVRLFTQAGYRFAAVAPDPGETGFHKGIGYVPRDAEFFRWSTDHECWAWVNTGTTPAPELMGWMRDALPATPF